MPTGQTLDRVVAYLLEPETGDSVYQGGKLTHLLPLAAEGGGTPVVKLMTPWGGVEGSERAGERNAMGT